MYLSSSVTVLLLSAAQHGKGKGKYFCGRSTGFSCSLASVEAVVGDGAVGEQKSYYLLNGESPALFSSERCPSLPASKEEEDEGGSKPSQTNYARRLERRRTQQLLFGLKYWPGREQLRMLTVKREKEREASSIMLVELVGQTSFSSRESVAVAAAVVT